MLDGLSERGFFNEDLDFFSNIDADRLHKSLGRLLTTSARFITHLLML